MDHFTFKKSLSVVVTAYNEEEVLQVFVNQLMSFLKKHVFQYEVIIVNDGSVDSTSDIMNQLKIKYSDHIRLQHLQVNSGMGAALNLGFSSAKFDWVTFFPADGQIKPKELLIMLEHQDTNDFDCVTTRYTNRKYSLKRKIISSVFHGLTRLILGCDPKNQGIYLLKRDVFQKLKLYSNTFLFNLELPVKVQKAGYRLDQVNIELSPRIAGVSKAMQKPRVLSTLWQMLQIRLSGK